MKKLVKYLIDRFLKITGIFPSVWMLGNPLKIYEYRKLVDPIRFKESDIVVDIGCGKGFQTQTIAKMVRKVIGIEISKDQYKNAISALRGSSVAHKVEYVCKPLEKANIEQESIDKVISFCVLEHIPNIDEVLNEAHKILKHGGELHATVDSLANIKDKELIEKHRNDHYVHQYFVPETITATLERAGFKVTEAYPIFTSDYCLEMFELRIRQVDFSYGMFKKRSMVREITDEESKHPGKEGIMVLVRAVKV